MQHERLRANAAKMTQHSASRGLPQRAMAACGMQHVTGSDPLVIYAVRQTCITPGHAAWSRFRWHAEIFYLGLHEFRMALVDLHLLELILPVITVQQATGL